MLFINDIKYALRLMLQKPAFAATTIFIMTIGLSLCLYNYSFIHGFMLKDLPFPGGDRMYVVNTVENGIRYNGGTLTPPDYLEIREQLQGVEQIGGYIYNTVSLSGGDTTSRQPAVLTDPGLFDYTAIPPLMGRTITEEDNQPGANKVMLVSYELWQGYFGARPDILGHTSYIDSEPVDIIGVMPPGYTFPNSIHLWMPMQRDLTAVTRKDPLSLEMYIKLQPGYSVSDINRQLNTIMARLESQYPETNSNTTAAAATYRMGMVGNGGEVIMAVMLIAVGFIMLMACTNVANLLLARASERAKETAVRMALGAPRGRLIMQMMAESLIICLFSGVLAILLAGWGLEVTRNFLPTIMNGPIPFYWQLSLDGHIVVVAIAVVLVTTVATGILPALKISGGDFNQVLRDGTRGAQSKRAGRASKALVIFEITLSCSLLTVATALAVGLNIVQQADYGVNPDQRLHARLEVPQRDYPDVEQQRTFYKTLLRELEAQPEIRRVGAASAIPGAYTWYASIGIEGQEETENMQYPRANVSRAMPGMLDMLDIAPLSGRLINEDDTHATLPVAVVSDSFAQQHWGSNDAALGKRFQLLEAQDSPWYTIVGVVPHVIFGQPYSYSKGYTSVFTAALQNNSMRAMRLILEAREGMDPMALQGPLNRVLQSLDKNVPAFQLEAYQTLLARNTAGMDFVSTVFNLFAIAAIALAATGIYGVMANAIGQRTQEFGIRRALGAPDQNVLSMLLKQGLWQLLIGATFGVPLAYLMGSQIIGMLGVESWMITATFAVMPLLIGSIVMFATFVPAQKAIRLEPSVALRYE